MTDGAAANQQPDERPKLSIVVPVYNEEQVIGGFLAVLEAALVPCAPGSCEVIFCDGGSTDATLQILSKATASDLGLRLLRCPKGRGAQCVAGIEASHGGALMLLHVDSEFAPQTLAHILQSLDAGTEWGCLTLRWPTTGILWRIGEANSNRRARRGIPFADQAPFMTRYLYDRAGGMTPIPLMEDYDLSLRLHALKDENGRQLRPCQLPDTILTSDRRFHEGGLIHTALLMRRLRKLYRQGTSPEELMRLYKDVR